MEGVHHRGSTTSAAATVPPSPESPAIAAQPRPRYFYSRLVRKGEIERPWLAEVDPKEKWVTIIPLIGLLLGLGIAGYLVYDGIRSVVHHKYCLVMSDDFSGGFNTNIWTKEAEVGGFGYVMEHSTCSSICYLLTALQ
jgi:hypothetical protein